METEESSAESEREFLDDIKAGKYRKERENTAKQIKKIRERLDKLEGKHIIENAKKEIAERIKKIRERLDEIKARIVKAI